MIDLHYWAIVVVRAYELAKKINVQPTVSEESNSILFGQTAATSAVTRGEVQ